MSTEIVEQIDTAMIPNMSHSRSPQNLTVLANKKYNVLDGPGHCTFFLAAKYLSFPNLPNASQHNASIQSSSKISFVSPASVYPIFDNHIFSGAFGAPSHHPSGFSFHRRSLNLPNYEFSNSDLDILNLRLKFNFQPRV